MTGYINSKKNSKSKKQQMRKNIWRCRELYLLIFPSLVLLIIFKYIPMYGLVIAFQDYNPFRGGITGSEWVGLKHFVDLFQSAKFFQVFRNTRAHFFLQNYLQDAGTSDFGASFK